MTDVPPRPSNAVRLAKSVRMASRQFIPKYGAIAHNVDWQQAPYGPAEKLALLIDNLICRGVKSINPTWRVELDRLDGKIEGIVMSAPGRIEVHPLDISQKLLRIYPAEGGGKPLLFRFAEGGGAINSKIAELCAGFFGDENGVMEYVSPRTA